MKAARLLEYGGELVLNDVSEPTIARDEVLVEIRSTTVNHLDLVKASGTLKQILPIDLPWIPGHAVQLASHAGAKVIATASGKNEAYLNSLGASRVIDYREAQFEKVLQEKVDLVFDLVGGDLQKRSFLVLKDGGRFVSATQPVSQEDAAIHHVSGMMMRLAPSGDGLGKIGQLLEERTIRPDVATMYALQDANQAWKDIAENLPRVHGISPSETKAARRNSHGKLVVRVA